MTIDRKALRELAERATPGPWEQSCGRTSEAVVASGRKYDSVEQVRFDGSPVADCDTNPHCGSTERQNEDNAAFIAAANPATILALLDELEAAEKAVTLEAEVELLEQDAARWRWASSDWPAEVIAAVDAAIQAAGPGGNDGPT